MPRPLLRPLSSMSPSISPRLSARNQTPAAIPPPSPHFLAATPKERHSTKFAPTSVKPPRDGSQSPTKTALPAMQREKPREDHLRQTDVSHSRTTRLDIGTHQRSPPHLSTHCHGPKDCSAGAWQSGFEAR